MITELFPIFGIHNIGLLTGMASQIVRTFDQEFKEDKDLKNAAIDAIILMLQKHKDLANAPVAPVVPEVPVA